ncbi:MAG: asparagine synthase (glutamine-hydrolyzing) [Myxococcota bacterium]
MCGIVGVVSARAEIAPAVFDGWRDRLAHRGPDQAATFHDRGLFLGFRRLAILDLSPAGHQPMSTPDGRYTIVFNGQIYNFEELRADLEHEGVRFRSRSDTEVLLALFAREGVACLPKLNGMYAFAIYDAVERTLVLVRDRLGVKPLFYWRDGGSLAFASELRAIRDVPGFPTQLCDGAMGAFFRVGSIPDWTCVHPGVSKLPPGYWLRFRLDQPAKEEPTRYWDLPEVAELEDGRSEAAWVDEIEALLYDATRIRLRSDVPLGVFLSGGIDSGLVAAAAARQKPGLACFTVGFRGEAEDETPLAAATARRLGVRMETLDVDVRRGMSELPVVIGHFDEPCSDTSALPTALICAEARKHLVVVLTGDAGDEVFGGYRNHVRAWRWRSLERVPAPLRSGVAGLLTSVSAPDSALRRFARRLSQPVGRFGVGATLYPFEDWQERALVPSMRIDADELVRRYAAHLPAWSGASPVDQSQRTDLRSYMLDDILVKVDRMSMRHSLELRSPFLDYRMVELGLRVPSRLRVRGGVNKYLLRRLAERHLPPEVCAAPKRGFAIPIQSWLRDPAVASAMRAQLGASTPGFPDAFVPGGAEWLWAAAQANPAIQRAVVIGLCYRWWCEARSAGR